MPLSSDEERESHAFKLAVTITCVVLGFIFDASDPIPPAHLRKMSRMRSSATPSSVVDKHHIRVSHRDLHQTTDGFSSNNLIGSGSSGSVCKGFLDIEG